MQLFSRKWAYAAAGGVLLLVFTIPVLMVQARRPAIPAASGLVKARGLESAALQIIEYSDFQCPACATVQPYLKSLLDQNNSIRLVFKHYPLKSHRFSPITHQAAECASRQGRFWDYHDRLYQEQASWSALQDPSPAILRYASEMGLHLGEFRNCLANLEVTEAIKADVVEGKLVGVSSTPSFLIGEKIVVGLQQLEKEIDAWKAAGQQDQPE